MSRIRSFFLKPKVRLALRALLAAATLIASGYLHTGSVNRALIVGGVLAFAEVFTPLNGIVGYFKLAEKTDPKLAAIIPLPSTPPPAA